MLASYSHQPFSQRWLPVLIIAGCYLSVASAQPARPTDPAKIAAAARRLFQRDNLVAWCIVPFDAKKRTPEQRAAMLDRLGIKRFAYDWRAEHVASFDAEMDALKRHHIHLQAFWFPASLEGDGRRILDLLRRHHLHTELWVMMIDPGPQYRTNADKVKAAARQLAPIADEAAKIGCSVGLYNHGGWFGEPENQLAILHVLNRRNVGMVYNLHHAHSQVDRFARVLPRMLPHLYAINLNGMVRGGDRNGRQILPLGQGDLELGLLRTICAGGYRGPIGILGHTMNDAEKQLRANLEGLAWLSAQLQGKPAGPGPKPFASGAGRQ